LYSHTSRLPFQHPGDIWHTGTFRIFRIYLGRRPCKKLSIDILIPRSDNVYSFDSRVVFTQCHGNLRLIPDVDLLRSKPYKSDLQNRIWCSSNTKSTVTVGRSTSRRTFY